LVLNLVLDLHQISFINVELHIRIIKHLKLKFLHFYYILLYFTTSVSSIQAPARHSDPLILAKPI
jgi:hypothetical protein